MIYAIKQYNCTTKALALMKYCKEFKDLRAGFPNGVFSNIRSTNDDGFLNGVEMRTKFYAREGMLTVVLVLLCGGLAAAAVVVGVVTEVKGRPLFKGADGKPQPMKVGHIAQAKQTRHYL